MQTKDRHYMGIWITPEMIKRIAKLKDKMPELEHSSTGAIIRMAISMGLPEMERRARVAQ